MLWLDEALEGWTRDRIAAARGKSFFGAGIATDESPPSQPRLRGLRFQVTFAYLPFFADLSAWEDAEAPPVRIEAALLDLCHCPGKDGLVVTGVVRKQLARLGLSDLDIVSGTGDGGGENGGSYDGLHTLLEAAAPGYVRRRCMHHIAWTVLKAHLRYEW